jgi:predicted nuclease of predicted toxin-antitoxin system
MKFLVDINIPQSVIKSLIDEGHDVLDIKKKQLNLKDSELVQIAKKEK